VEQLGGLLDSDYTTMFPVLLALIARAGEGWCHVR